MSIDLRHAGLGEDAEQRIRLAASAMAAHHFKVLVSPWDGPRCSVLVADAGDAYGRAAMSTALRRGTPVLALAADANAAEGNATWVQKAAPIPVLVKAIEQCLPGGDKAVVIYCATENNSSEIARALSAGADDYVMKPFDRESLRTKLAAGGVL